MEMGTGKTKVALDTMSMLYQQDRIEACVVIAPKGVYDNWTRSEIPTHVPDSIERIIIAQESIKTRSKLFLKTTVAHLKYL